MTDPRPTTVPELETILAGRLRNALSGVPHVSGIRLSCTAYTRMFTISYGFAGWSPTLHKVQVRRRESLHLRQEAIDEALTYFTRTFDQLAALQRQRSADAGVLGYARPLPTREIGHLDIDKAFAILREDGPEATRAAVLEAVRRAHAATNEYDGGNALHASGVLLGDSLDAESGRWLRICAPNVKLRSPDGSFRATLRGFELELDADHRPEETLAEFEGRPLRDLLEIHPLLDGRTIRTVSNRTWKNRPGLIVRMDMQVDRIDAVLAEAADPVAA